MTQNDIEVWEELFVIITTITFAFIGSGLKSYISSVIDRIPIKINKIMISTIVATLVSYYIIYPLCRQYNCSSRVFTGTVIVAGFLGYAITVLCNKFIHGIGSLSPKKIVICIFAYIFKLLGADIDISTLLEDDHNKSTANDIHHNTNTYTTINNNYINSANSTNRQNKDVNDYKKDNK